MPLKTLWEQLADITTKSGMQCGRSDACNSDCCRPTVSGSEPGVTPSETAIIDSFLLRQREFRLYEAGYDSCKFLDKNGKCRIYAVRPIDCRTHFCKDDSLASQSNHDISTLVEDYHARHEAGFMATELIDSFKFHGEQ